MKKETDGNQAATQSSGVNRGSAAQKASSQPVDSMALTTSPDPSLISLSVEQSDQAIWDAAWALHDPVPDGKQWKRSQALKQALDAYALALRQEQQQEIEPLKQLIADLNNELKGSHGFFLTSPSLVVDVAELKALSNRRYNKVKQLESQLSEQQQTLERLQKEIKTLRATLHPSVISNPDQRDVDRER